MTLPPLSPALRQQLSYPPDGEDLAVPHFAALYRYLSHTLLEPSDGSTLARNELYEKQGISTQISQQWIERVRGRILSRALRDISVNLSATSQTGTDQALTPSLRETILIIATYMSEEFRSHGTASTILEGDNSDQIEDLLADEHDEFTSNIDNIARIVGKYLIDCEKTIREMLSVLSTGTSAITTPSDSMESKIPSSRTAKNPALRTRKHHPMNHAKTSSTDMLETQIDQHNHNLDQTLPVLLSTLTTTLQTLLDTQTTLLTTHIQHLETFTHSTQSRNLITHSQFLSTVSKGITLKAQILSMLKDKETYAQKGIREALHNKSTSLHHEEESLIKRETQLRDLLNQYDSFDGGESTFRTLGAEYARVEAEIEDVKKDIERLEKGENQISATTNARGRKR